MSKLDSKKFTSMIIGTSLTGVFTTVGLITILMSPETSSDITSLITVSLTTINGCIGAYAIGQSAVDFKKVKDKSE